MRPSYGLELMMRVRMSTLPVHAHTAHYGRRDNDLQSEQHSDVVAVRGSSMCSSAEETLAHFLFDCPREQESIA